MMITGKGWTMHLGDCLEVMAGMEAGCVDHVITDPPYGEEFHGKARTKGKDGFTRNLEYGFCGLTNEQRTALARAFAKLSKRWSMAFSDPESSHLWRVAIEASGMRYIRKSIWVKLACTPQLTGDRPASGHEEISIAYANCPGRPRWNGGGERGVWSYPIVGGEREHTTPKPEALMLKLVDLFTDPGDLILDPFAGSGTTGVAAIRLGRRFIGIERDPTYFKLACDRLRAEEQDSTLQAQRAGQGALFK